MKLTKLLAVILSMCMVLALVVACDSDSVPSSSSNVEQDTEKSKTQAQYECGKAAYDELVYAADICEKIGDSVYNAWFFAIYEADDYSSSEVLSEFSNEVGISVSDLEAGASEVLGEYAPFLSILLDDFNYTVDIVTAALEKNGAFGSLRKSLENAKAELKTMTQEYSDYSEYPTLKSFYSKVDSYATFIMSPTGSFEQLQSTIENYENEIRTYKSDLSFIFED